MPDRPMIGTSTFSTPVTRWITVCHAPDREHGWRGSMAAALHTLRHVHNERVRQSIQHVLARLERCTANEPVAQTSTNSDHTR